MAISFNTGTTSIVTNSGTPSSTVTIPAGVLAGDTILVIVGAFSTATGTLTCTLSSSATAPVLVGTQQDATGGGFLVHGGIWKITATASDAGATLTYGATGGSGGSYWFNVGIVSYSGTGGVDVNAGNNFQTASWGGTVTTPSATTNAAGDWQVQLLWVAPPNGTNLTVPGALTQREAITSSGNSGLLLNIADSNASVGGSGTSIGNTSWTATGTAAQGNYTTFTVGLQPASSGASPPPQPGTRAWRRRWRRPQQPWSPNSPAVTPPQILPPTARVRPGPSRARVGRALVASGIAVALATQPGAAPKPCPVSHPKPAPAVVGTRRNAGGNLGSVNRLPVAAPLQARQLPSHPPPSRAIAHGVLGTVNRIPVSAPQQLRVFPRLTPQRAIAKGVINPFGHVAAGYRVAPPNRVPVPPVRAIAKGVLGKSNQTIGIGTPLWRPQPRPRPLQRAIVRSVLGPVNRLQIAAPKQLQQPPRQKPLRAIWRGGNGTLRATITPTFAGVVGRSRGPLRAIVRSVLGPQPIAPVSGKVLHPPAQRKQPPNRAIWRGILGPPGPLSPPEAYLITTQGTYYWAILPGTANWETQGTAYWTTTAGPIINWSFQPTNDWVFKMAFNSVSAASTQYIPVLVTATIGGTPVNPTTNTVQMGFVQANAPGPGGVPSTWQTAAWLAGPANPYWAQCLVGPSGGTQTLTAGIWNVWIKISGGSPETIVQFVAELNVY